MKYYQNKFTFTVFIIFTIMYLSSSDILAQYSTFGRTEIDKVLLLVDSAYKAVVSESLIERNGLILIRQITLSEDSINYQVYFVFDGYSEILNFLKIKEYWLLEKPAIDGLVWIEGVNENAINVDMKLKPFVTSINNGIPTSYEPGYVLITSKTNVLVCLGWYN